MEVKGEAELGSLTVVIAKGNLIHYEGEVIVNPANTGLSHGAGAAKAISDASENG